jgi:hypothetical protein
MEMAGIEPASREFDLGYATSLVGLLLWLKSAPTDRVWPDLGDPSLLAWL